MYPSTSKIEFLKLVSKVGRYYRPPVIPANFRLANKGMRRNATPELPYGSSGLQFSIEKLPNGQEGE
jgi:hypothetical protein